MKSRLVDLSVVVLGFILAGLVTVGGLWIYGKIQASNRMQVQYEEFMQTIIDSQHQNIESTCEALAQEKEDAGTADKPSN